METWIRKKQYESREDYILRVYDKFFKKELDMTVEQLGDLLDTELDESLDESTRRKKAKLILKSDYTESIIRRYGDHEKLLKEIKAERLLLEKENRKKRDANITENRKKRNDARVDSFFDQANVVAEYIAENKPFEMPEPITMSNGDVFAIALLGDIHFGAYHDNYFDKYSPEICKQKMNEYADKLIHIYKDKGVTDILLVGTGDYINHEIHEQARRENSDMLSEQILKVADLISEFIRKLTEHVKVEYIQVAGNHDRATKRYKDWISRNHYAKLIEHTIKKEHFHGKNNNPNLKLIEAINVEDTILLLEDYKGIGNIAIVHGNIDNVKTAITKLEKMFELTIIRCYMGHYHKGATIPDFRGKVIVNGSIHGSSPFVINKRMAGKPNREQLTEVFYSWGSEVVYVDLN